MADDKKPSAFKESMSKYGEKIGLGVAVLALLAYAVVAFGMSEENPNIKTVKEKIKKIEDQEKIKHKEMEAPELKDWHAKAVSPWNTVISTPRSPDDWGASLLTKAEGTALKKDVIRKTPVVIPEVKFVGSEVAIDSITVAWAYKDFTAAEKAKMMRDKLPMDAATVSHFVLEREVNGSGKWEVIADKLDPKTLTYKDSKIEPKTKYAYRVTAYSTDQKFLDRGGKVVEVVDGGEGATPNPAGRGNIAMGAPVQTLGIWKLNFTNPTKPPGAAKGMVYIKIEKFEKGYGKVEKARIHYAGDRIGWWEETPGAEPVSKHRVSVSGGKSVEVDFNTGATLLSVEPTKLPVEVKKCKTKYAADGTKIGCDTIVEKRNFDTNTIIYTDDEGEKKIYSPNPQILDQLCEDHGGRKILVNVPGEKETPDQPRVDPKVLAAQKKEMEAEKLFNDAETAYAKEQKTIAIGFYQKLLKDFATTDFVAKHKKVVIEERIASIKAQK